MNIWRTLSGIGGAGWGVCVRAGTANANVPTTTPSAVTAARFRRDRSIQAFLALIFHGVRHP